MADETRNIVVLGASFAGLSAAHYMCRHTLPKLQNVKGVKYVLHLVDQSTHFWWHNSAPRAIVSVQEMQHKDTFVPIMDGFKQYSNLKDSFVFHQGTVNSLDTASRKVSINKTEGGEESLEYYALIIATGVKSPTPLTTFHGDHTVSQKALEEMNQKLKTAKEIVVAGGGPIGVETAGELGAHLKGQAKITLVAGSDKLLPVLRKALADKAGKLLEKFGVKVLYNVKVQATEPSTDGKTTVKLDNGDSISADVYIPAVGVEPNTSFLPANLKGDRGFIKTNAKTMRVDDAGSRVYALGDVAAVDKGGVLNMFNTVPVWGANFTHDLLSDAKAGTVAEKSYQIKWPETQLVPVGAKTGVGAVNGWSLPGFAVSMMKGKDYMLSRMPGVTQGEQWSKA
jgi:apoptosis-inducing factor 2